MMIYCYNLELIGHVLLLPGSLDSEVTEEQKKEKAAELKKKEKDLQDTLTQKLEELKKLCMREAVSVSLFLFCFSLTFKTSTLSADCWLLFLFAGDYRPTA